MMPPTAIEFYSGIGGLHRAFAQSKVQGQVRLAFDWDQNACKVYKVNHPETTVQQIDISTLSAASFTFQADVWLLSPACQPYTVLNTSAKGSEDPRARSFLSLIKLLPELVETGNNPARLLVENVAGFETSTTRQILVSTLRSLRYDVAEFLLTPLQFGTPNSRLRYYLLAKKAPRTFGLPGGAEQPLMRAIPGQGQEWVDPRLLQDDQHPLPAQLRVRPIRGYLDPREESEDFASHPTSIPDKVLTKWGRLFDIVLPSANRTCCFTRGYTQLVERAGSILQTNETLDTTATFDKFLAAQSEGQQDALEHLHPLGLRYFTPSELLRLFSFTTLANEPTSISPSFIWPGDISKKTKYRLIGNSVNVKVVKELLDYLFEDWEQQ